MKDYLYGQVKAKSKEVNNSPIMSSLIQEQIATFHLLYSPIERRSYTNSLLKVGMLFS